MIQTDSRYLPVESMIVTVEKNGCVIRTAGSADPNITRNNSAASTTLSLEMKTGMHIVSGALLKVTV